MNAIRVSGEVLTASFIVPAKRESNMEIFETRNKFVLGTERNGVFELPVRGESFSYRLGRNLDKINLTGCYAYKTEAGAKAAQKRLAV